MSSKPQCEPKNKVPLIAMLHMSDKASKRPCHSIKHGIFVFMCLWFSVLTVMAQVPAIVAGNMLGEFSVSESGAATYSIPIQIPPGVAGMEPRLALGYNSQAGTGFAGMGWGLEGLGVIARCPSVLASDGVRRGINFDLHDRYCLDGQRLMLVSGSYGAAGSEYRTEREGFSKITAYGSTGNGPLYWVVKTKAGLTMEYGNTADSRIEAIKADAGVVNWQAGTITAWAQSKVIDIKGNYYSISYSKGDVSGDFYPSKIDYAGNSQSGVVPVNSIQFALEDRVPGYYKFNAGSLTRQVKRLAAISIYQNTILLNQVKLSYVAQKDLLSSVTLCTAASSCFLPIRLSYKVPGTSTLTGIDDLIPRSAINGNRFTQHAADWNGDGITDFLWYDRITGENRWYISSGNMSFSSFVNPITPGAINGGSGSIYVGDWNGDGYSDLVWYDATSGQNRWFVLDPAALSSGNLRHTNLTNLISPAAINGGAGRLNIGDWNSDGLTDVMWYEPSTGKNRWFTFALSDASVLSVRSRVDPILATDINSNAAALYFGDWNGDGQIDVMWHEAASGNNRWYVATGDFVFNKVFNPIAASILNGQEGRIYISDWNGDGVSDIFWYDRLTGNNKLFINTGILSFQQTLNPINPTSINGTDADIFIGDSNSDGISDLMMFRSSDGVNRWYRSSGYAQFSEISTRVVPSAINGVGGVLTFGDWNGDGISDVAWFDPVSGANRWFVSLDQRDSVISEISNAGTKVALAQASISRSAYTKDTGANAAVYPRQDLQIPMQVVSEVSRSNGLDGFNAQQYKYGGLKAELGSGRGVLGFRWMSVSDLVSGVETYTEYQQSFPYTGMPIKSESRLAGKGNGGLLKRTSYTLGCQSPQTGSACVLSSGNRYFTFVSQSVEESWDLEGAAMPVITSNYSYGQNPQYGDPTQITVNTNDGSGKTVVNEYWPADETKWQLGRLKRASVTNSRP